VKVIEYLKTYVEDVKAWRRGEKRVAPRGARGRVYALRNGETPAVGSGTTFLFRKEPTANLVMRVIRADGSVETIKVPAQVNRNG
jgi:hypothetical protein